MKSKDFPAVQEAGRLAHAKMAFYHEMTKGPSTMKIVKGNLLDLAEQGEFTVIVQGCNCFNTMGSGIAKEIKARYPEAYKADINYSRDGDYNKLGCYSVMIGKQFNIINAYTQYGFAREGDVFEYDSFKLILQKLAYQYPTSKFGFPKIGCGLAGGDESRVMGMIEDFSRVVGRTGGSVTVVEFQA
jgi:O-acetyl-ADP-ribose deacetylase (regulator of RNase III)